jgi:hypothetical protein
MKQNGYMLDPVGDTRVVWDGSGTCPVTGPVGPTIDGDNARLQFTYSKTLNVEPDSYTASLDPTHFYFIYYISGTGRDTDGTVYTLRYPTYGQSSPDTLATVSYEEPDLSITHVWYWPIINHIEVEYEIEPNDAEPSSINSAVTVSTSSSSYPIAQQSMGVQYGTIDANMSAMGDIGPSSASSWVTEVTMTYSMGGQTKTKSASVFGTSRIWEFDVISSYLMHEGPPDSATVNFEVECMYELEDRHEYSPNFYKASIEWGKEENGSIEQIGSAMTFYPSSMDNPYYGPYPYSNSYAKFIGYSFWCQSVPATPPVGTSASHFRLIFTADGYGTDTDGTQYPFVGGEIECVTDWMTIPS